MPSYWGINQLTKTTHLKKNEPQSSLYEREKQLFIRYASDKLTQFSKLIDTLLTQMKIFISPKLFFIYIYVCMNHSKAIKEWTGVKVWFSLRILDFWVVFILTMQDSCFWSGNHSSQPIPLKYRSFPEQFGKLLDWNIEELSPQLKIATFQIRMYSWFPVKVGKFHVASPTWEATMCNSHLPFPSVLYGRLILRSTICWKEGII